MIQQISTTHTHDSNNSELSPEIRRRRAVKVARARREKVERQRRTILFTAMALILGVILAFSVHGTSAQATGTDQASDTYKYYKEVYVESGDTLWSIAEEYTDGSVSDINECISSMRDINNLHPYETLKAGTYIIVPYYSTQHLQ